MILKKNWRKMMKCDICGKKADKFYNLEGDKACSECVEKWEKRQDVCPSYLGHLQCAEAEDYKNLEAENKRLTDRLDKLVMTNSTIAQIQITTEAENKRLKEKIDLALLELAHILGEKTPTEIRVEQALKGE